MDDLTLWPLGDMAGTFKSIIFKLIIQNSSLGTDCEIALKWMPMNMLIRDKIGSVNSFMLSRNEPLREPMLTHTNVTIWCH